MWDGRAYQEGFPPNTICGLYARDEIDVAMFTTGHEAEVEFRARAARRSTSFALSYTFVNIALDSSTLTHNHMKPFKVAGSLCSWSMNVNECGDTCWIFSPGYPGIYPPNVSCQYRVTSDDPNTMLQLTFDNTGPGMIKYEALILCLMHCTFIFLVLHIAVKHSNGMSVAMIV
ncbi:hypothetical protein LSAT2_008032 [Lamellibrachia satsuma]|nr:hypothetical protein LSAT2_008032 [Lamellibrachia satsuma]